MYQKVQPEVRISDPPNLPFSQIESDLRGGQHVIIQFVDRNYTDSLLNDINELCAKYDKSFGVRFYGHYFSSFDGATLLKIPNVKCLYVDCLMKAANTDVLSQLKQLEKLSIGIYELQETEILNFDNFKKLEDLTVTETKTKALNLVYLKDYKNLKSLIIGGHSKNIDAVGELSELQFLTLHSVKKASLSFINKLHKLKTLNFLSGGRDNIHEIGENQIENLEIIRVRGFHDLGDIKRFTRLKTLLIEDQIQLKKVIFDTEMPYLQDIQIINCKTLQTLDGLAKIPHLHRIRIYRTAIEFTDFIAQKLPALLKILAFYTGKSKVDAKIERKIQELGYLLRPPQ